MYAEIVRVRTIYGAVHGAGQDGTLRVLCLGNTTIPAGSYEFTTVELNGGGAGAGYTLTFADGVIFTGGFFPYCIGWDSVIYDCVTTSVRTTTGGTLIFIDCGRIATSAGAGVPAFDIASGLFAGYFRRSNFGGYPDGTGVGGSALFNLSGTATFFADLHDKSWVIGNPFTNSGTNTIQFRMVDANTAAGGDTPPDATPWQRTYGTNATTTIFGSDVVEGLSWISAAVSKVPTFRTDGKGFKNSFLHEARIKDGLWGTVYPNSLTTLAADGIIFGGISHGTVSNVLEDRGYLSTFTTAAVAGSDNGWATTGLVCDRTSKAFAVFKFNLAAFTTRRVFIGLTGTHIGASRSGTVDSDTPIGDLLGVQYSTDRGDTQWQFLTQQSGGAQNLVNSSITPTNVILFLVVDCRVSGEVTLTLLDNVAVRLAYTTVTGAASLPLIGSGMGMNMMVETRAASAASVRNVFSQLTLGEDV